MISAQMQLSDIFDDVYTEVKNATEKAFLEEAKDTTKYLRQTSPKQKGGSRAGKYARGWRYSYEYGLAYVYNQTDWQLTHLLNDGHNVKNRWGGDRVLGHYAGDGHITEAEQRAQQQLPLRISRGLKL